MTDWFTRYPQNPCAPAADGSPVMVIDPDNTPDWVRLPPDLGGATARVLARTVERCVCGAPHDVTHLHLEGDIAVAECSERFLWYAVGLEAAAAMRRKGR